jgi:hypothetical protein
MSSTQHNQRFTASQTNYAGELEPWYQHGLDELPRTTLLGLLKKYYFHLHFSSAALRQAALDPETFQLVWNAVSERWSEDPSRYPIALPSVVTAAASNEPAEPRIEFFRKVEAILSREPTTIEQCVKFLAIIEYFFAIFVRLDGSWGRAGKWSCATPDVSLHHSVPIFLLVDDLTYDVSGTSKPSLHAISLSSSWYRGSCPLFTMKVG